ncbi:MAG: class IV adenylate cyclase [Planctomycetota bacterium]
MRNFEFKAELRDLGAARRQCEVVGAERVGLMRQTDEYFRMADGRLKRRTSPGEPTEWILYDRFDSVVPRPSDYERLSEQQARRRWGSLSLRPWVTVSKTRELWMLDNVRIHLDQVDGLGRFIEFEAVVSASHDDETCEQAVHHLRRVFEPWMGEPIAVSYADLVAQEKEIQ